MGFVNNKMVYFGDTNGDGIIGINQDTLEEDIRKIMYTWEDLNDNGVLDYKYDESTGEFTLLEKVVFSDENNNGILDFQQLKFILIIMAVILQFLMNLVLH